MKKILVINPGSTSTKIAFYHDGEQVWKESIEHDAAVARQFFCETRTEFLRKNSPVLRSKSETRSLASTAP